MSYTVPTAASIKARFIEFAAIPDPTIEALIVEATRQVDTSWLEGDYDIALQYLVAHLIVSEGMLGSATDTPFALTGFVHSERLGDASITYADGAAGVSTLDRELASTLYGRRFLAIRRQNFPAVAQT